MAWVVIRLADQCAAIAETAALDKQLDSHLGGDIYRPMHPLKTSAAFHKWRKKISKNKKETA